MRFSEILFESEKQRLDPKCWKGYKKQGTKIKGGVRVNNCVPNANEGVAEGSLNEFAVDGFNDGDNRSKLLGTVGRLLQAGNKVDWQVPGQMGHVTQVKPDGITMKKWKQPYSRMSFFLPMYDDSRDSKYTIKMIAPKHYAVVSAEQGVAEAGNKPMEPHIGMGDSRTPRELKTQMRGASDEFVRSTADKKTGPFHSKVAKMQGKLAKSELRRREQGVAEGSRQYHVVSKLDGNVLASYKTREDAQKNAHGNPVVSGSLETIGDRQYVREQGVAEATGSSIQLLIQKLEDMSELIYQMVPGSKQNRLIDKRDELEAKIESMPGGKEALRNWAREYNDSFDEGVAEDFDGEYDDEAGMAHTNLITIARAAQGLLDTIDQHENLPEWVQEKIARVEGMLVKAWDYLKSQEAQGIDPKIAEMYQGLNESWQRISHRVELNNEFNLIENFVNGLAARYEVSTDYVWEDLESLTDDELYVFAVTSEPVMEDWQKVNKRDKTDGMSKKAVAAYRREHPGSKLKTAVTTKPSKLKKGSKASKRRKSYCSRSKGQMDMHNISCAKTPDKAICKARRRWNC